MITDKTGNIVSPKKAAIELVFELGHEAVTWSGDNHISVELDFSGANEELVEQIRLEVDKEIDALYELYYKSRLKEMELK